MFSINTKIEQLERKGNLKHGPPLIQMLIMDPMCVVAYTKNGEDMMDDGEEEQEHEMGDTDGEGQEEV